MSTARATIVSGKIAVSTLAADWEFQATVDACKSVPGARWHKSTKTWRYPLAVETCLALRRAFGESLRVGTDLADWYRTAAAERAAQTSLSAEPDATLARVPAAFAKWLRPYQRAGAAWTAKSYRNGGIVADEPGLGKTTQTLAGLVEAGITGPVLIVCPRASVRLVWGMEIKRHMPDVPVYLCSGTRAKRERELERFAADFETFRRRGESKLQIVVVVAEMLRVEMGDACYTESGSKITPMCPNMYKSGVCLSHIVKKFLDPKAAEKDRVPVGFSFPILFDPERAWSAVILDESHKLLGSLTIAKGNLMGKGLKLLPQKEDTRKYALSGTPFGKGGRVEGMFGTLHWLWPDEYTSFWRWAENVFQVTEKVVNRRGKTVREIGPLKGLSANASAAEERGAWEEFLKSFGPRILRRTKREMLKDLPAKTYVEVVCPMTPAQLKQTKELAEWAEITTKGGIIVPNGHLAMNMRSRQLANGEVTKGPGKEGKLQFTGDSGKIEQLWQKLDERGILDHMRGGKVIIASEFNEFLDVIRDRLVAEKVDHFMLTGQTTDRRRDEMIGKWQSEHYTGPERIFLVNTKAAGISINLDAADEMFMMDEDTDPGVNVQLEDRIHRASRNHQVVIYNFRTEGTIDFKRAHDVEFRRRVQHAVLDARRGQKYIQQFMVEALEDKEND